MNQPLLDNLRQYYGLHLKSSEDLATNACCAGAPPPQHVIDALANVADEVMVKFYGCGHPIPQALEGAHVLDLGSGSGRDVYVLSQLVGPRGFVHGVDMTPEQLAVARRHVDDHMARFGIDTPNVAFHEGFIEDLSGQPFEDGSLDLVISNCVVNLSPRKDLVLAEAFRVLRTGGEVYLSDVVCDRRLPPEIANDPVLHAECLGGASYLGDFLDLAKLAGFGDPRIVSRGPIEIGAPKLAAKVGAARFESVTFRFFKVDGLETRCEDFGQVATYRGGMPEAPHLFWLDDHHAFEVGRPERVCSNTAAMLTQSRYGRWFDVTPPGRHYGEFPCEPTLAARQHAPTADGAPCC